MSRGVGSESPPFHVMDLDLSTSDDGLGQGHAARRNSAIAEAAGTSSTRRHARHSDLRSNPGRSITSPQARASSSTHLPSRETRVQDDEEDAVQPLNEDTAPSSQRSQRIRKPSRKVVESGGEAGTPPAAAAAAAAAPHAVASSSSSARNLATAYTTPTTHRRHRKSLSASPDPPLSPASSPLASPSSSSRLLSPPRKPSGESKNTHASSSTTNTTPQRSRREHRPSRKAIEAEQDDLGRTFKRDRSVSQQGTALRSGFAASDQPHPSELNNVTPQGGSSSVRRSSRMSNIPTKQEEQREEEEEEEAKSNHVVASHLTHTHDEVSPSPRAAPDTPATHASTSSSPATTTSIVATGAHGRPNRRVSSRLSKSVTAYDVDLSSEEDEKPRGRSRNTMSDRTFTRVVSNASNASSAITDLPDDDDEDQLTGSGDPEAEQVQRSKAVLGSSSATRPDSAATIDTDTEAEADSSRRSLRVRRSNPGLSNVVNNSTYSPSPVPQAIERTKATQRRRTLSASSSPAPSTSSSVVVGMTKKAPIADGSGASSSSSGTVTPRPRSLGDKTYLVAGLYARDAHVDPVAGSLRNGRLGPDGKVIEPPKELFPLPVHFGKDLLVQKVDFELPDIFLAQSGKLRERFDARRKPPPYRQIDRNRYVTRKKIKGELPQCNCDPSSDCGDNCLNRLLGFICDAETCPCGARCTNVSLAKRPHARCDVAYYGQRGFGLRTLDDISKDNLVDEYRGEVINLQEAARRVNELYKDTGNFYFLEYDAAAGEVLDGGLRGNVTRFANHSCNPNCYIEKFIICGTDEQGSAEFQIGLFALRDIAAGEELTYDYGWSQFTPKRMDAPAVKRLPDACYCGAPGCSGTLGAKRLTEKRATADTKKGAATIAAAAEAQEQYRRREGGGSSLASDAVSLSRLTSTSNVSSIDRKPPLARVAATTTGKAQQLPLGGSTPRGTSRAAAVLSRRAARRHAKPASRRLAAPKRFGGSGALSRLHKLKSSSSTVHSAPKKSTSSSLFSSSSSKRRMLSIIKKSKPKRGTDPVRTQHLLREATQMVKPNEELARIAELAARTTNNNQSAANAGAGTSTDASTTTTDTTTTTTTPTTVSASTATTAATPPRISTRLRKSPKQDPVVLTSSTSPSPEAVSSGSPSGQAKDDSKGASPGRIRSIRGRSSPYSKSSGLPNRPLSIAEARALVQKNLNRQTLTASSPNISAHDTIQQSTQSAATTSENGVQVTAAQKDGTDNTPMDADQTWVTIGKADDSISEHGKGRSLDHPMGILNDGTASRDHSDGTSDTSMSTSVEDVSMATSDDSVSSEQRVESAITADSAAVDKTHDREQVSPVDAVTRTSPVIPAGARKVTKRKRSFDETELDARSPPPKIMSSSTARARVRNAFADGRNRAAAASASPPLSGQSSSPSHAPTPTPPRAASPVPEAAKSSPPQGSRGRARNPPRASRPQAITRDETEEPSSGSEYVESPSASPPPARSTPVKKGGAKGRAKGGSNGGGSDAKKQILTIHGVPRAVNHRASVVSRKKLSGDDPVTEGRQQYQSTRDLPHNIMTQDGYFIPGLPTELLDLGIFENMREARKARNAFLVRIRRSLLAGNSPVDATDEAAYRHPQKGTPLALARTAMAEKLGLKLPEESLYHLPREERTSTDPRLAQALAISIFKTPDGQAPAKAKAAPAPRGKGKGRARKVQPKDETETESDADEEDELVEDFGDDESVVEADTAPVYTGKGKARQID